MRLYGYWRSSASWRVRIALALYELPYEYVPIDLTKGEQNANKYLEVNPSGLVPALVLEDGTIITQSVAIIEYLQAISSACHLFPNDAIHRARVWQIAMIIACDTHPLQNLRELVPIANLGERKERAASVIRRGLALVENLLNQMNPGIVSFDPECFEKNNAPEIRFCIGNQLTLADLCLVPQVYNARRWGVDVNLEFPTIAGIDSHLGGLEIFRSAHPDRQPDAKVQ